MKSNYTLTEAALVTLIAAAVLTAAVSGAHAAVAQAKAVACKDVLRKIGQAAKLYAEKNAGFVPCETRKDAPGFVENFGNNQSKNSWGDLLIWGGYFGNTKPAGRYEKLCPQEKMKYFICPDDQVAYKSKNFTISYQVFSINAAAAVARKRFGDEQYSRVLITRDRPENSVVFDVFPYRAGIYKNATHGETANVLRLGGEVDSCNIKPAATAGNVWNWIGEFMDGIEL